ncbi:hypothetical protein P170DRAFT_479389 [Aspergillus steynii IBT 23096]|uniref:GST C-terminal domain-containing protein n=1 Tax=Aspergillus steynii IBT 23096 TaxID=1392250 RepID=A0A2I2FW26_9EURO|nr:uncharacterized protein P170DRAFT_479389 [Aspergillus steynii IBT 23096]PLB44842.1 hypothetical protein P170DRAFT_479389 [Aspergillus steynii IBT 23096]
MAILTIASRADLALVLPVILGTMYVSHRNPAHDIPIEYEDVESLRDHESACLTTGKGQRITDAAILCYLMNNLDTSASKRITEWLHRSTQLAVPDLKELEHPMMNLESHLTLRSHIVGYSLTLADLAVWGVLRGNTVTTSLRMTYVNINRWFTFIEASNPWICTALESLNSAACRKKVAASPVSASFKTGLKNTASGIVTRLVKPMMHHSD